MPKVLLVDDETAVRNALRKIFERAGLEVRRAPHLRDRVVFLTGAARDPSVHRSLEQRGVPLIYKLDDLQIVLDAVRLTLLRGGRLGGPAARRA